MLRYLNKIAWGLLFLLGCALTLNALTYLNFNPNFGFLKIKQTAIASGKYLPFYYLHVLFSGLILLAGFVQVSKRFRNRWISIHRKVGYFYVMGILFLAAPGGLGMSFFVDRGPMVLLSFLLQVTLWFYFTLVAFLKIRKGDVVAHELWMWRSFFPHACCHYTACLYFLFLLIILISSQPMAYAIIAWTSWVPNLLLVEYCKNGKSRALARNKHDS